MYECPTLGCDTESINLQESNPVVTTTEKIDNAVQRLSLALKDRQQTSEVDLEFLEHRRFVSRTRVAVRSTKKSVGKEFLAMSLIPFGFAFIVCSLKLAPVVPMLLYVVGTTTTILFTWMAVKRKLTDLEITVRKCI